jgi:hypothetical protein
MTEGIAGAEDGVVEDDGLIQCQPRPRDAWIVTQIRVSSTHDSSLPPSW